MKKNYLIGLLMILAINFAASVRASDLVMIENAIESEKLEIKISKDQTGIVRGKTCDRCEVIVVNITPQTKFFIKGKEADLSKAASYSGKPGTAIFNIKSRKVTKIKTY